jgi:crossover junction endodeoxyribonuclease RuvC
MAIEAPFFGKNVQSMLKLGRAQGVAITVAPFRKWSCFRIFPEKISNPSLAMETHLKNSSTPFSLIFCSSITSILLLDATDALVVAVCHQFQKSNFVY